MLRFRKASGRVLLGVALGLSLLGLPTASIGTAHADTSSTSPRPDVEAFGADYFGSTNASTSNHPIVGLAETSYSKGYWEAASDGSVYPFGRARFYGSMRGKHLNQPIIGIAAPFFETGYWLAAR